MKSLYERGNPIVYREQELKYIGMPVGGIFTGQLYLGGDGKLWRWDIFNHSEHTGAAHYAKLPDPDYLIEQGFYLKIGGDKHSLDKNGFSDVSFKGQYPIGEINYKDSAIPIEAKLEAYSSFIPLNSDDSGLPATIMQFTLKNVSSNTVTATINGMLENAVCQYHRHFEGVRKNRLIIGKDYSFLNFTAEKEKSSEGPRTEIVFEDWDKTTYKGWMVEGNAWHRAN